MNLGAILLFCCIMATLLSCSDPGFGVDYYISNESSHEVISELWDGVNSREYTKIEPGEQRLANSQHQLEDFSEEEMLNYAMQHLEIRSIEQKGNYANIKLDDIDEWIIISSQDKGLLELLLTLEDGDF